MPVTDLKGARVNSALPSELCHLLADSGRDPKLKYKPESHGPIFTLAKTGNEKLSFPD